MRIACLAWGSLIWKPAPLTLASAWHDDGPPLPIEFVREADGGELATALAPGMPDQPTHWARLTDGDLADARERLRVREQVPAGRTDGIDSVARDGARDDEHGRRIAAWAATHDLDAVIWTALPARSRGVEGRTPSVDEACAYLGALPRDRKAHAEHYVRSVPTAIRTAYRAAFELRFGWAPVTAPEGS